MEKVGSLVNNRGQEKALHTVPRGYMILHRQTYSGIHLYSRPQTTPKTTQAGNPFFQHLWLRYSSRRLGRMRIAGWPLTYLSRDGGQRGKYRTRNGISAFVYALLPKPHMLSASQSAASRAAGARRRSCRRTFPHGGAQSERKNTHHQGPGFGGHECKIKFCSLWFTDHAMTCKRFHMQQRSGWAAHH